MVVICWNVLLECNGRIFSGMVHKVDTCIFHIRANINSWTGLYLMAEAPGLLTPSHTHFNTPRRGFKARRAFQSPPTSIKRMRDNVSSRIALHAQSIPPNALWLDIAFFFLYHVY